MPSALAWISQGGRKLYFEYGILALLIMLPMLLPGYIFAPDMTFSPTLRMPAEVSNLYPLVAAMHFLNIVVPSQVIQKLVLLGILVLCGVGAHRLAAWPKPELAWGSYFAGILYMINPFTYSRFIYGQIFVLLSYALMPFFVITLQRFLEGPDRRSAIKLSALAVAISIISIHSIFFMVMVVAALGLGHFVKRIRDRQHLWQVTRYGLLAGAVVLLVNSFWLVPMVSGTTQTGQALQSFDQRHVIGFQTATDNNVDILYNVAAMYGFWGERDGRYLLPKTIVPGWHLLFAVILVIILWGVFIRWRRDRGTTIALVALGVTSWVFAIGIAYDGFAPIYNFMVAHVPLFRGYREPQKFVGLLVLVYAYFGAFGVQSILEESQKLSRTSARSLLPFLPITLLMLPILYTPTMLWGFSGQLRPADYPADWYAVNRQLNNDHSSFKVLFLPWHQYMSFGFARAIISNPAQSFFDKPVIQGDNFEFGQIETQTNNPVSAYIQQQILQPRATISDMGTRLAPQHIKYVVLAKEVDWDKYGFLNSQKDLKLISDGPTLRVYQNVSFNEGK